MKTIVRMTTLAALTCAAITAPFNYPKTERIDRVDEYHGVKVPDPYQWLENDVREDDRVAEWVEAQNRVTFGFLEAIPERERIQQRVTRLWNYERYSAPSKLLYLLELCRAAQHLPL